MKVVLESTDKVVTLVIDGAEVPARVWEGVTAGGIRCHAFVTRMAVASILDSSGFERDLKNCRPASPEITAIPLRLVL